MELLLFHVYTQRDLFADVSKERRAVVITIGNYVKPKSLEEAYELNQARSSRVMGGRCGCVSEMPGSRR